MSKVTMYPTGAEQPNRNKSSGLQGKCYKAVRRNGTTYDVSCSLQKDPKYHHEWSNVEEIFTGGTIQCGRPSTKHCSHKTYYSIKGYRNTCPIAGISGTYTQPATLRLFFNPTKKGVVSSTKIKSVQLSFEHRCVGVDVANGKETTVWGPNFSGGKVYPNKNALTIKLGGQTKIIEKNPPLSSKFDTIGPLTFKDITFNDLAKKGLDIIYGNNLETNPGNIYVKNVRLVINYENETPYIEGKQNTNVLYLSDIDSCRSQIKFTLEAGYKQGSEKVPVKKAPKILQKKIKAKTPDSKITVKYEYKTDNKTVIATLTDKTNTIGNKKVSFFIEGTNKKISFSYEAKKRNKVTIITPPQIEYNTIRNDVVSIIAKDGCVSLIEAFDNTLDSNPIYTFNNFNFSDKENYIPKADILEFYKKLSSLSCGYHKIIFKRDGENSSETLINPIEIVPTSYKFEVTEQNKDIPLLSYETRENKAINDSLELKYIKTKELINAPSFIIQNPTHNSPEDEIIGDSSWNPNKEGGSTGLTIGRNQSGNYKINIKDVNSNCPKNSVYEFKVDVIPTHQQFFDEIFVRGEDSTSFNYDYLVAMEGDSIAEPIYVDSIELKASYKDIKICTERNRNNKAGLTEIKTIDFQITNTSSKKIKNLFLELNALVADEEGDLQVTTAEWLEPGGIFYNFKENFDEYNEELSDNVSIKNLTSDDDNIDEENVYICIKQIDANTSIDLKLPYGSNVEKEAYLEVLLFEEPLPLYELGYCKDDIKESRMFNLIPFSVYDSVLTDLSISGETDLFNTEIDGNCPKECFFTDLTYQIMNIDTSTLDNNPETNIINDPRLIPYKFSYGDSEEINVEDNTNPNITFINKESERINAISGAKIELYVKFDEHDEIYMSQYTNYKGEVSFFITIPSTISGDYSIEELLNYMSIEFQGDNFYNGFTYTSDEYKGTKRIISYNDKRNDTIITPIENPIRYGPGQVVPLKIKLEGKIKYLENRIIFKPEIKKPGESDKITVFYKICNLENNEGILKTIFKTNDENGYELVPNEAEEIVYCGINTDLKLVTRLEKIVVENDSINRLYLHLKNKRRNNKNIRIEIEERCPLLKYNILGDSYSVDKGEINIIDFTEKVDIVNQELIYSTPYNDNPFLINENGELVYSSNEENQYYIEDDFLKKTNDGENKPGRKIVWTIDYLDPDVTVNGYIDLKAFEVGKSKFEVTITDFIEEGTKFGKDSYKCECRKEV